MATGSVRSAAIRLRDAGLLLACLAAAGAAHAASYRVPDDRTLVLMSDRAVRARVLDQQSHRLPDGRIVTDVRLVVEATLRGPASEGFLTVRQPGGVVDDEMQVFPGTGTLHPAERVVLLLRDDPPGPPRILYFALGKFHLGAEENGEEAAWRDDLESAFALAAGANEAAGSSGRWRERLRDAGAFERWIEDVSRGLNRTPDYFREAWHPLVGASADFTMLGIGQNDMPARREEFDAGQTVTYHDDSAGPAITNCHVPGDNCCSDVHGATGAGVAMWNTIPSMTVSIAYGGTDSSIAGRCFNNLHDEINYDDPCNDIKDTLVNCNGTLAIGGFSASLSQTSHSCPAKGPTFARILAASITTTDGVGNCLTCCDFKDMIAHETGHTIGFGHSDVGSALMAPFIVSGRCGQPQADDIAGAQCVYPAGDGVCERAISSVVVDEADPANVRLKVLGAGFRRGDVVQVDNGSGFENAPLSIRKSKSKIVAKHVESLFPPGSSVDVRVVGSCASNALSASR